MEGDQVCGEGHEVVKREKDGEVEGCELKRTVEWVVERALGRLFVIRVGGDKCDL